MNMTDGKVAVTCLRLSTWLQKLLSIFDVYIYRIP